MGHIEIIRLAVAYTLLGAFVFTVVVTCLSLIGVVRFADKSQQSRLFGVLIIEIIVVGVGYFANILSFSPGETASQIRNTAERERGSVYIQVAHESQRSKANSLKKELSQAGYLVPGIELVDASIAPDTGQIRYFYPEQESNAKRLKKELSEVGLGHFRIQHLGGYEGKAPQTVMEIWFPR